MRLETRGGPLTLFTALVMLGLGAAVVFALLLGLVLLLLLLALLALLLLLCLVRLRVADQHPIGRETRLNFLDCQHFLHLISPVEVPLADHPLDPSTCQRGSSRPATPTSPS